MAVEKITATMVDQYGDPISVAAEHGDPAVEVVFASADGAERVEMVLYPDEVRHLVSLLEQAVAATGERW